MKKFYDVFNFFNNSVLCFLILQTHMYILPPRVKIPGSVTAFFSQFLYSDHIAYHIYHLSLIILYLFILVHTHWGCPPIFYFIYIFSCLPKKKLHILLLYLILVKQLINSVIRFGGDKRGSQLSDHTVIGPSSLPLSLLGVCST